MNDSPSAATAQTGTISLNELLEDAATELDSTGMHALSRAVQIARMKIDDASLFVPEDPDEQAPMSKAPVPPKIGERSWWALPIEERDAVISELGIGLDNDRASLSAAQDAIVDLRSADRLDAVQEAALEKKIERETLHSERLSAAISVLSPDWRSSILAQLGAVAECEGLDDYQLARVRDAIGVLLK